MADGLTKEKLLKFISIRNASGFSSNLQFQFDASEAGFSVDDLGDVGRGEGDAASQYIWQTPFGKLIEEHGELRLEADAA